MLRAAAGIITWCAYRITCCCAYGGTRAVTLAHDQRHALPARHPAVGPFPWMCVIPLAFVLLHAVFRGLSRTYGPRNPAQNYLGYTDPIGPKTVSAATADPSRPIRARIPSAR
jgi:hypothetical protein